MHICAQGHIGMVRIPFKDSQGNPTDKGRVVNYTKVLNSLLRSPKYVKKFQQMVKIGLEGTIPNITNQIEPNRNKELCGTGRGTETGTDTRFSGTSRGSDTEKRKKQEGYNAGQRGRRREVEEERGRTREEEKQRKENKRSIQINSMRI